MPIELLSSIIQLTPMAGIRKNSVALLVGPTAMAPPALAEMSRIGAKNSSSGSRRLPGNTLPAHVLEEISIPLDCDTFVFGDDKAAKGGLMELMARIPGLRPLDVGGLSAALTVEGMTALLIRLNRRYKSRLGRFGVVGLGA